LLFLSVSGVVFMFLGLVCGKQKDQAPLGLHSKSGLCVDALRHALAYVSGSCSVSLSLASTIMRANQEARSRSSLPMWNPSLLLLLPWLLMTTSPEPL
jgi:hypothetical protein